MSDIVERLRRTLSDLPGNDDDLFNEIHAQRDEAADEIERLQAEVEEQARLNGMGAERELAAEAEIKSLRAALEGVMRWNNRLYFCLPAEALPALTLARAALEEKKA